MLKRLRIKTKLQLAFLVFGLFIVVATGWQAYTSGRSALEELSFHRLTSLRESKKSQIEFYFDQLHDQAATISENLTVQRIYPALRRDFFALKQKYASSGSIGDVPILRQYYKQTDFGSLLSNGNATWKMLASDPSIAALQRRRFIPAAGTEFEEQGVTSLRVPPIQTEAYEAADALMDEYAQRFGYSNIMLVDTETGFIIYTLHPNPVFAASLLSPPFSSTRLAAAFTYARDSLHAPYSGLTDFSYSIMSPKRPVAYIASPLSGNGNAGVLILEIGTGEADKIMTGSLDWERQGLGKSGESYIVGSDLLMRSDSRFLLANPKLYRNYLKETGVSADTIRLIDSLKTTILLQPVQTSAATRALGGQTNTTILDDYRGEKVLSSYSPLHIRGVDWVIIAEIDTKEAFASVYALQENLILFAFIILLIAAVAGYVISKTISNPISLLASATEHIGKGNLAWRVQTESYDEIGDLARTFNVMADNLKRMTDALQNEVAERMKAESNLQESHERLRSLSAHLQTITEEERKALAREIHDELGQALTALKMETGMLEKRLGDSGAGMKERLAQMNGLIGDTIQTVKRLTAELRPGILDDLGLSAAVEWQAEEFMKHTGIQCTVVCSPQEIIVAQDVSIVAFRLFQETLTNVARHAEAQSVHASLEEEEGLLQLIVADDGIGISSESIEQPASFGILGMRERVLAIGGTLEISGETGKGTTVKAILPINARITES